MGGVVGYNEGGTIINCYNTATLGEAEADSDVEFIAQEADPDDLTAEQTITIGDSLVLDLRVLVDGTEVTDFLTGKVTISLPYELEDGETAENLKVYYVDDEGNKTLIESSFVDGILTFVTDHFSLYMVIYEETAPEWENPFTDVADSDWFYTDVMYAHQNGIMAGTSDTTFDSQGTATRAMIVTVLYRMADEPMFDDIYMYANFGDVVQRSWYELAVGWASYNEIAVGVGEGMFAPDAPITREQLVTMLWRYANSPMLMDYEGLTAFADISELSLWAQQAMAWAHQKGIITGKSETILDPQGTATRAEIAAMMHRFMEME